MSLILEKKGPFLKESQWFREKGPKRVSFEAFSLKKGLLSGAFKSTFWEKGVFFPFVNVSERDNFSCWRTIICPPF